MASNKKAQILAAVMCASSIFGSYTVVSAADTPTKIESTDKNSSVTANGSTITATAGAQGSQQSTITLGNKSLAINVGKQTTTDGTTYGTFTLNSSNLAVNNSGLSVKNTKGIVVGSISNTGAITGTGLTIKNGTGTTLASLNNNGLNIYDGINTKATATITKAGAITGTGLTVKAVSDTIKPEGDYVESKVTTSGVADTIKQGGFTRATSNVAINSIKDTIYTNDGKELSSSNISKSVSDATESGSVTLIANKITTNDDATTTTLTSKLNLTGDSATLTSGTAYVKVDNTLGNVTLSGNNATLSGSTFTLKDANGKTATLNTSGLTLKDEDGNTTGGISSTGAVSGTSLSIKAPIDPLKPNNDYIESKVTTSGVADTIKQGGFTRATSNVAINSIKDTIYTNDGKELSSSNISKSVSDATESGSVTLIANKITTNDDATTTTLTSKLNLTGDSATLTSGTAYVKVDNTLGNVTLSGNNATLSGSTFTLKDANGKTATLNTSGLTLKDEDGNTTGGISSTGAVSGTSLSIKAPIDPLKPNNDYIESKVTTSGVADTIKQGGFTRATSNVAINSIKDTIYTNDGKELSSSNISKSVSDATESGSVTLIANKITTNDDATTTTLTSKLNLTGDSATLTSGTAYVKVDNTLGNVTLSGNNATLSGSTFTLKDANGKTATLNTSGLTLKDEDGNTTGGISSTGAITGTSLRITTSEDTNGNKTVSTVATNGVTDTVTNNKTNNKTTSQVSANGVTDTVYGTDGTTKVASSSVSTSGISNTTSLKTTTGKIDTAINQNTSGVGISSTKYDTNNNVTDKTSVSVNGGTSSITSYGSYIYGEDGKATSYNQVSMSLNGNTGTVTIKGGSNSAYSTLTLNEAGVALSGKNASLSGSTFTLKDTTNGKTLASLGASGLSLNKVNSDETTTNYGTWNSNGLTVNGTGYTTIKSTNATTGAMGQSQVSYNGVTDTVTNAAGNKTTSQVSATGVTDRVYDTDGTTQVAYSNVGTSGISNTTTNLQMTGANAGNTMSTALNQNSAGITASATKKAEDGSTIGTSTLTLGGNSASLKVGNYGFAVDSNNNVSIAGNNATLSGSTFTLKDANGKTATLNTSGLTLKDEDGNTTGGISSTGAITGTSLRITTSEDTNGNKTVSTVATNGVTDTVTNNKTNNKTTSQVSANGVTDTVYGTDETTKVAYSSVGTGGISNTTSLKTDTGKIDTAINQNKSGVSISSTAYSGQNLRSGNSSVSVNGAKTTISSSGGYEYSSDGEVLKYNTASLSLDGNAGTVGLSGKNVSLTNTDLTLKNVETGKAYVKIGSNGLNIYNDEGTSVFGVTRTGAINIDKNVTIDDSYTKDGYTYTASNSISGSNGIRNVATKKDESGKTIATSSSTVTTSGITNSTNISGIAIKDDKNNTKTMNTSIAQNANGVSISSTKYNVYSDGTNTIQTTDGTSSISVNGAKTTISGYGSYEYERDESGKLVVSSRNSASLSVDGESGIIGLSGKNVGLDANGLTLYKDVEGVKTQYASLNAGGLNVNGTGTTTIKSTNATTGAMGQSQLSYNGVTDTVTNAAGNKTTSTVNATGTIDQVYDVDGKTRIAYSNVTTSGITDSFTKDGITNSVTTNANGTTFSSTGNGSTTIKGDTIKTTNLIVNGKDIGGVAAGIDRNTENEDGLGYYTQIEGKTKIYNTGRFSTANGNFVVDPYGSITSKAGNYRFNMDRTSGFDLGYAATTSFTLDNTGVSLGFRNNSFILDKNGATFINANGENVSFTSINGGTITTGETVINGSSITTKDLYVDNIHLNGAITDDNGNVVGGGDLSLGADGTLDLKYNANGITNTFVSGATGVHSSFSNGTTTASSSVGYIDDKNTIGIKDQVGNTSVTTTTDGTTFANGSGSTTINGGNITTTGDVTVGGDLSVGDNFKVDGTTGNVTGGTYNGVQISTDKDGNAIIGGTNIGDLATNEEVNKVNDKVDAVDNKVGDTSKLDKEITDNQNYKDNQNLVGAVNAEADIRRNEISRIDGQIEQLDGRVGSLENRMSDVEDRIDKVGAMSAAIANLRTMGFDPEAPTEIAIGVGQYKSETGLALGVFHYPNQDFMLSASISTSGDEVMGGIGATWKLGRKSAAEKAKDEEARRLEKAEEMKKLAQDAKVKAQAERHAKLLAEREAQKTA